MKTVIITICLMLVASAAWASGTELLVPSQYPTIQSAIDAAFDGDTVIVAPGTYTGPGNRDIEFLGKAITVRSEEGPETCIIDCNGTEADPHRGFCFNSREDSNSVLKGFTIVKGYGPKDSNIFRPFRSVGGAIYFEDSGPL